MGNGGQGAVPGPDTPTEEARKGERSEESEGEHFELSHQDPVRVVIVGVDERVVEDNFSELLPGAAAPDLGGHSESVFDLAANQPVGHVFVDVNREFLSTESHGLLNTLLYITAVGGTLTIGVAILLAAWLSKRITSPVTALVEATHAKSPKAIRPGCRSRPRTSWER